MAWLGLDWGKVRIVGLTNKQAGGGHRWVMLIARGSCMSLIGEDWHDWIKADSDNLHESKAVAEPDNYGSEAWFKALKQNLPVDHQGFCLYVVEHSEYLRKSSLTSIT